MIVRPTAKLGLANSRTGALWWLCCGLIAGALCCGTSSQLVTAEENSATNDETEASEAPDANEGATSNPWNESPITDFERDHWSFLPLQRAELPTVQAIAWPKTPIDRFVLAAMEARQLQPAPPADPTTVLRRVYLDLVGLPPTTEQVDAYLDDIQSSHDGGEQAYLRVVDQLLASPQYGEHWAQYWLDLARFAETDGFELDKIRPRAWQYRDWVVRALNADMPYDQFVQWQVAGDVLAPNDPDGPIATIFCLSGPDMPDINSQEERKHTLLDEMTGTLGAVVLGLQIGCAQCHNHMFDPISQADFYRLRAFFDPAVHVERDKPVTTLHCKTDTAGPSHLHVRGDWRRPGAELQAGFPRIANPRQVPVTGRTPNQRRAELAHWLTQPDHPLTSRVIVNRLWQYHFGTGLSSSPSDFGIMGNAPTHPELLDWLAMELVRQDWRLKSLHRLIVTSAVYRQASFLEPSSPQRNAWDRALEKDPTNELLCRFPRRRLAAEVVRDAMLAMSGALIMEPGGPGVRPPLPEELVSTLLKDQWNVSSREADHRRRSIYVFARRNLRYPMFAALDRPAANTSCPRRQTSTTAPQALFLLNSSVSLDAAQRLAGRVLREAPDDMQAQIIAAVRAAWTRAPHQEELAAMAEFLHSQRSLLADSGRTADTLALPHGMVMGHPSSGQASHLGGNNPPAHTGVVVNDPFAAAALTDLCLALINASEFLYLD